MPRSYGTGPRQAEEPEGDKPAGPEDIRYGGGPEAEAEDAEGHGFRSGAEDRAQGDEPTEPGDPDKISRY
jgi:hypothetical protein